MSEIETSEVNVDAILDPQDIRVSIEDVIVIKGQDADIAAAEAATSAANEAAINANQAGANANAAAANADNAASNATEAAINANNAATNANEAANNANETANQIKQRADSGEFNGKDGKSAYQYAQDGGYTGTETEFAKKLASDVMIVKLARSGSVWSADKTYFDIMSAVMSGTSVFVLTGKEFLPFIDAYDDGTDNSNVRFGVSSVIDDNGQMASYTMGFVICKNGHVMDVGSYVEIPTDDHINALIDANVTKENVEAALGYEPLKGLSIAGNTVQPNGGVADVPIASYSQPGVVCVNPAVSYGISKFSSNNNLYIAQANEAQIDGRLSSFNPVTTTNLDYAVKAAMTDGKGAPWTAAEQKAARERMNAADANKVYIMQKQIENLQGIAATEETDSTEAYTKTVPTGAQKWASMDKVGGKTVVWNQHCDIVVTSGGAVTETDEYIELSAESMSNRFILKFDNNNYPIVEAGHKYLFMALFSNVAGGSSAIKNAYYAFGNSYSVGDYVYHSGSNWDVCAAVINISQTGQGLFQFMLTDVDYPAAYRYKKNSACIFDLTQMFGAGNEPSTVEEFRAMFPADYYPYNPGELMSAEVVEVESKGTFPIPAEVRDMCPGYGWSAGTACNEIDFGRKVYVQRVGSVDLDIFNWTLYSGYVEGVDFWYTYDDNDFIKSKLDKVNGIVTFATNGLRGINKSGSQVRIYVPTGTSAPSGLMYYELAEPIEFDLSDVLSDDHYIEVEAGGTVTFKQASTQLPVPSSVTYQISTSEVIANA